MSARRKLNQAYLNGTLLIAGGVGVATGSWGMFLAAAGFLIVLNFYSGNLRVKPLRRP